MIKPELELRPIARRGLTDRELEIKRYADSELHGSIWSIFSDGIAKQEKKHREKKIIEEHEQERLLPIATAHSQKQ